MKTKVLLAILLCAFFSSVSIAQTADKKWAYGLNLGLSEYNGDLGNGFFKFDISPRTAPSASGTKVKINQPGMSGVSLARYINKDFDLAASIYTGEWGYVKTATNYFHDAFWYGDIAARWKFIGKENARFTPYFMLGIGGRVLLLGPSTEYAPERSQNEWVIPIGAGMNVKLNERWNLNLQSNFGWTDNDRGEGRKTLTHYTWDQLWHHSVGISYNFGKTKDADGDGVSDHKDKCPNTPANALVDKNGCILDADKDGIADNQDACPLIAGLPQFQGCPDTDKDGIVDSKDKCPEKAGIAKFDGCPDTDGDNIEDRLDKCPTVAGIAAFGGCPDSDRDGIPDAEDACPDKAGTLQFKGCPDTDGDGIPDINDKCPTIAGIASEGGCPEIKAAEKKVFEKALKGVQFETGKSTLTKASLAILNEVAEILRANPTYRLFIAGHTDNAGVAEKNLKLSKERAATVEKYIEHQGIEEFRISSEGYGDTQPVADNTTPAGKAKNRRVEFKVSFEQ